ncbi:MAG: hypothetical protein JSV78_04040, partial [Phycisphaerales bacterium]
RMTVLAVANPVVSRHQPARLHDNSPGYGIVRLNRKTRQIVIECWPRWSDPSQANARQYPGWPIKLHQLDNRASRPVAYLPVIEIEGKNDPVIRVIEQSSGEIIYALRISGRRFHPWVLAPGKYTVEIGEPGTQRWRRIADLQASTEPQAPIRVAF